jgi:hypothetical protein
MLLLDLQKQLLLLDRLAGIDHKSCRISTAAVVWIAGIQRSL